jgi:hypothetical protein
MSWRMRVWAIDEMRPNNLCIKWLLVGYNGCFESSKKSVNHSGWWNLIQTSRYIIVQNKVIRKSIFWMRWIWIIQILIVILYKSKNCLQIKSSVMVVLESERNFFNPILWHLKWKAIFFPFSLIHSKNNKKMSQITKKIASFNSSS